MLRRTKFSYQKKSAANLGVFASFTSVPSDPKSWPKIVSDTQWYNIVRRRPRQIDNDFPDNAARRRFSTVQNKRVMNNRETVSQSWLVYSEESDKVFCFCYKLFGKKWKSVSSWHQYIGGLIEKKLNLVRPIRSTLASESSVKRELSMNLL